MIHGYHPVREALRHGRRRLERVLIATGARGARSARADEIQKLCAAAGVPVVAVDPQELDALTEAAVHNGFAAIVDEAAEGAAQSSIKGSGEASESDFVVLLEDVQDPRNLGAILRVCDGAGVDTVLIRDRGSAPLSAAAVKTSAGAASQLDLRRITNSAREIALLKEAGFWVYGAAGEAGDRVWDVDLTGQLCLVLGGEQKGLRPRTRKSCDRLVSVPMLGSVASLNVASAAAALLYEAVRQRHAAT